MTDIFETLELDHQTLLELLRRLEREGKDEQVLDELRRAFDGLRAGEEEVLYPRLEDDPQVGDLVREGYVEHHAINMLLRETIATTTSAADFRARSIVLREMLEHHYGKEEGAVFLRARQLLGGREQVELNDALNDERRRAA